MHRLLQGDVGSGKTVVAALSAAAVAIDAGWQCALMAPTEILAEQHFRKLVDWLQPLGITVAWLTGSRKGKGRTQMLAQVASGEAMLVVGTHAVIQDDVAFAPPGPGHRRRAAPLRRRAAAGLAPEAGGAIAPGAGRPAHPLAPSEPTPADDERDADPAHAGDDLFRRPRRQHHRRAAARPHAGADQGLRRRGAATWCARIRDEVARGRQVYWVCPLVEESEHLDLQNATATHAELGAALPGRWSACCTAACRRPRRRP
jgi:ATP-dependent DNA helicase RecG